MELYFQDNKNYAAMTRHIFNSIHQLTVKMILFIRIQVLI